MKMQAKHHKVLKGIDVSHWQGIIDWNGVKADGVSFAYLKATEGLNRVDPRFRENASGARWAGVYTGGYHFARPDLNPTLDKAREEVLNFIDTLQKGFGAGNFGDIYPVLDLELPFPKKDKKLNTGRLLKWASTFNNYFRKLTGKTLMIYTGVYFIREYDNFSFQNLGNPLAEMPLWIALYPRPEKIVEPEPPPAAGNWNRWTVWQYTSKGKVKGIEGDVDLNWAEPGLLKRIKHH